MSVVTETFTRKPFEVEAVQVTAENMKDVAEWCGGVIDMVPGGTKKFIKVDVARPLMEKQTKAFIGDWVLRVKTSFKVYTNKAFVHCFDKGSIKSNYIPDTQPTLFDAPAEEFMKVRLPKGYPEPSTR